MRNKRKKFDFYYILLVISALLFLISTMRSKSFFGSSVDWYNQHIQFPDYFRKLFYHTGQVFPSFAFHLGGGQNIYHFSYYGLYNPLFLFSYLLPFIKMIDYMQSLNILIYISTGLLFYAFLKKEVSRNVAFFGSIFFFLSTPILFQVHRHYMFVDYLPFLLLSLFAIHSYMKNGKISSFILFNTLLIFSSYYYSISSILVEIIYFTYLYLKDLKENQFQLSQYIKRGLPLAFGLLLSIGISAILLLPTIGVIKNGRDSMSHNLSWYEIILPNFNIKNVFYDYYGLGLSFISILSIFSFIFKKDKNRGKKFLGIVLAITLFFPIIMYLLNGRLYIRSKVLIPFILLVLLLLCHYLESILNERKKYNKLLFGLFCLFFSYSLFFGNHYFYFFLLILDFIFTYLLLSSMRKKIYINFLIAFLFILNIGCSYQESFVDRNYVYERNSNKEINTILAKDKDIYRMKQIDFSLRNVNKVYTPNYYTTSLYSSLENQEYRAFLRNELKIALPNRNKLMLTSTKDLIFDSYLGVKYVIGKSNLFGYHEVLKNIYSNSNSRSIIYASDRIINEKEYEKVEYPYNLDYLFQGVITNEKSNIKVNHFIQKVEHPVLLKNKNIEYHGDKIRIEAKRDLVFNIPKSETLKNKLLFIQFRIRNQSDCNHIDRFITINGIKNKLSCSSKDYEYQNRNYTFHYTISENNDYKITIGKGIYDICDLAVYSMDYESFKKYQQNPNNLEFNYDQTVGDRIEGRIKVDRDSYLVSTIPYDQGFSIYIDGVKSKLLKVNKAFLGTKIKKGNHHVKIVYTAKFLKEGKIISFISFILFIIVLIYEKYVRYQIRKK